MSKPRTSHDLTERVAFESRAETHDADDDGNYEGEWIQRFESRAGYIHRHGGEAVMASRLQGQHVQVIFVPSCRNARSVPSDWRIRDVHTDITYDIKDITVTTDRLWVDFLCQSGGADG